MPELITAILVGAGARGIEAYGAWALKYPNRLKFIAVAEPRKEYRDKFIQQHEISLENSFASYKDLFKKGQIARAAFICTPDQLHLEPTLMALSVGYDVLLEKPMANTLDGCIQLVNKAKEVKKHLQICHTLRYTHFFSTIKAFIDSGRLGKITSINHAENVTPWHMSHSYVRGNWRDANATSPMILAKCCHDLDLIYWMVGKKPVRISSFGNLTHYKAENAPSGVPDRCTDGCPVAETCPYNAIKIYIENYWLYNIGKNSPSRVFRFFSRHPKVVKSLSKIIPPLKRLTDFKEWPVSVITSDFTLEGKMKALREGPWGRCVYKCDNNVVDHQQTIIEFENEVTAELTMHGHSAREGRTVRIDGTKGTLIGRFLHAGEELWYEDSLTGKRTRLIKPKLNMEAHGGGDRLLTEGFVNSLQPGVTKEPLTDARASLESHLMAFAAEKSRLEKKVIEMEEYHNLL